VTSPKNAKRRSKGNPILANLEGDGLGQHLPLPPNKISKKKLCEELTCYAATLPCGIATRSKGAESGGTYIWLNLALLKAVEHSDQNSRKRFTVIAQTQTSMKNCRRANEEAAFEK